MSAAAVLEFVLSKSMLPAMGSTNGNRFKIGPGRTVCPLCKGYPPLKPFQGRLRPECDSCDGMGSVPKPPSKDARF